MTWAVPRDWTDVPFYAVQPVQPFRGVEQEHELLDAEHDLERLDMERTEEDSIIVSMDEEDEVDERRGDNEPPHWPPHEPATVQIATDLSVISRQAVKTGKALDDRLRVLIVRRKLEGFTRKQTAADLGVSESSVQREWTHYRMHGTTDRTIPSTVVTVLQQEVLT